MFFFLLQIVQHQTVKYEIVPLSPLSKHRISKSYFPNLLLYLFCVQELKKNIFNIRDYLKEFAKSKQGIGASLSLVKSSAPDWL